MLTKFLNGSRAGTARRAPSAAVREVLRYPKCRAVNSAWTPSETKLEIGMTLDIGLPIYRIVDSRCGHAGLKAIKSLALWPFSEHEKEGTFLAQR